MVSQLVHHTHEHEQTAYEHKCGRVVVAHACSHERMHCLQLCIDGYAKGWFASLRLTVRTACDVFRTHRHPISVALKLVSSPYQIWKFYKPNRRRASGMLWRRTEYERRPPRGSVEVQPKARLHGVHSAMSLRQIADK